MARITAKHYNGNSDLFFTADDGEEYMWSVTYGGDEIYSLYCENDIYGTADKAIEAFCDDLNAELIDAFPGITADEIAHIATPILNRVEDLIEFGYKNNAENRI